MATELAAPSIGMTRVKATVVAVVAFVLGVVLVACIALSTGWRSDDGESKATVRVRPPAVQTVDCRVGRLC